jgi:hypothetical protein
MRDDIDVNFYFQWIRIGSEQFPQLEEKIKVLINESEFSDEIKEKILEKYYFAKLQARIDEAVSDLEKNGPTKKRIARKKAAPKKVARKETATALG